MKLSQKLPGVLTLALCVTTAFADDGQKAYLALGDSIPFGFDSTLYVPPFTPFPTAAQFIGYPEIVSKVAGLADINLACPGETSGSFLIFRAPDNGCNGLGPQGQPPFKPTVGLHTNYPASQMEFAVHEMRTNKAIELVTLNIGGNDLSLLQMACEPTVNFVGCVGDGLPRVLATYGANVDRILDAIRNQGEYHGQLILVTTYSPSANPLFIGAVMELNNVLMAVGEKYQVKIADGFGAFQVLSKRFGGDPCAAGLLIKLPAPYLGACDIHPSKKGRDLLAATVLLAMRNNHQSGNNNNQ